MNSVLSFVCKPSSRFSKIVLFLGIVAVILFRELDFFTSPHFWAEEGTIYFYTAYVHSWFEALLSPHIGYYSLFSNLSGVFAANLVSLKNAPYITVFLSFLVQLVPFLIIINSNSKIWNSLGKKIIGVLIVLFTLQSGELWLNTINSQFYLSLSVFLILIEESLSLSNLKRYLYRFILLLSGLTGVLSGIFLPLYIIIAFMERSRERVIQTLILLVTLLIQLYVIFSVFTFADSYQIRLAGFDLFLVAPVLLFRTVFISILGPDTVGAVLIRYVQSYVGGFVLFLFTGLIIVLVFWLFSLYLSRKEKIMFIGAYLILACFSLLASLGEMSSFLDNVFINERYFYVPSVIFLIMLFRSIVVSLEKNKKYYAYICSIILVMALIQGVRFYRSTVFYDKSWPQWADEVEAWEKNPNDPIQIWPAWDSDWKLDLPVQE